MRYNQEVKLVTRTYDVKNIDNDYEEVISDLIPVRITGVSNNINMSVFGNIKLNALAVHIKGIVYDIDSVIIDGAKRKARAILKARKNTIVIIEGD